MIHWFKSLFKKRGVSHETIGVSRTSHDGIYFLREKEGVRKKKYYCSAKKPTIGVGHVITEKELSSGIIKIDGVDVVWKNGLTDIQIDGLLKKDLKRFEKAVNSIDVKLAQHEFDALVSFAFNVGVSAFSKSTMARLLAQGDKYGASQQFERWVNVKGKRVEGLVNRRRAEKRLFLTGKY